MAKSYLGEIPKVHIRDYQRTKLYKAEEQCVFWQKGINNILDTRAVQDVVRTVAKWANIECPTIVYESTPYTTAYATAKSVVLPFPRDSTLPFLCHELSHVINYNSEHADHHGEYFVTTYLNVVNHFIGKDAFDELSNSFKKKRVKYFST